MEIHRQPDEFAVHVADSITSGIRFVSSWIVWILRFAFVLVVALARQAVALAMDPRTRRLAVESGEAIEWGWWRLNDVVQSHLGKPLNPSSYPLPDILLT